MSGCTSAACNDVAVAMAARGDDGTAADDAGGGGNAAKANRRPARRVCDWCEAGRLAINLCQPNEGRSKQEAEEEPDAAPAKAGGKSREFKVCGDDMDDEEEEEEEEEVPSLAITLKKGCWESLTRRAIQASVMRPGGGGRTDVSRS